MRAIAELMPPEYHGVYAGPADEDQRPNQGAYMPASIVSGTSERPE